MNCIYEDHFLQLTDTFKYNHVKESFTTSQNYFECSLRLGKQTRVICSMSMTADKIFYHLCLLPRVST
jgi:hypothetical protein